MRDDPSISAAGPSVGDNAQTCRSFGDKWSKNPKLALEQTLDPASNFQKWILERNGWETLAGLETGLRTRRRVLDAGCGNGRVTALLASAAPHAEILGVDQVDLAPATENAAGYSNASFRNANLRLSLTSLGVFDFIYCQEVLHHTGDAQESFNNLVGILAPQGEIAIYVYRRKAPAREFMDDIVRERISSLPYEEAMTVCRQITELGRRLAVIEQEIECEDIPAIGIEQGRYTPQRILYNFFLKCYWNPDLPFEENAAINYDWYHPTHCSRHTLEEVEGWFGQAGLQIIWQEQDLYGITMRGLRKSA
jgi:SAM-dependent methyltransferase